MSNFRNLEKLCVLVVVTFVSLVTGSYLYCQNDQQAIIDSIRQSSVSIYYHSSKNYGSYFEDSRRQNYLTYGSGVVVASDSTSTFILTNYHVVANGYKFRIKDYEGSYHNGAKVAFDRVKDLALLKITEAKVGRPVELVQMNVGLSVGDHLFSIGNPKGYSGTFVQGYISALGRNTKDLKNLIQLDMSVEEGSSGSGVFNSEGKLVGLVVGVDGKIGLAIGLQDIQNFLRQNEERLR